MGKELRILTVIGARPQIIKAAAIGRAVAARTKGEMVETILHTGQHYDQNMSQVFFDELGVPRPEIMLGIGGGEPSARTARMIDGIGKVLGESRHDVVLLYGDTDSTLAGAVAAAKHRVPVAHVEAGLRSYRKTMPEEVNRIAADHCSTWLFCPTETAVRNLVLEGFAGSPRANPDLDHPAVHMTGDVMYDNSLHFAELANKRSTVLKDLGLGAGGYALVTVHRDHNTDMPERLESIMEALIGIRQEHGIELVLPVHPRLRKCMDTGMRTSLKREVESNKGIHLVPPAGFLDMIELERNANLVLTDSGGVQKEAFFFGKPCVILREETEWVELVEHGQAALAGTDQQLIINLARGFLSNGVPAAPALFGDGHAAERVIEILLNDHT